MRGEVLGGWHGHETHPEVSAEGGQVPHFADSGGGVVLAGTVVGKMKTLRQEVTVTVERTTFIAVFPHCACIAISRKACVAFTARGEIHRGSSISGVHHIFPSNFPSTCTCT